MVAARRRHASGADRAGLLAVPPILAATYAGIRSVDRSAVDAAVGMGMRPMQVLFQAEVPMALPLIVGGLRSATLQVCATATIAAYASFGGLGRLLDRRADRNDYAQVLAGAMLVAVLAIALDLLGAPSSGSSSRPASASAAAGVPALPRRPVTAASTAASTSADGQTKGPTHAQKSAPFAVPPRWWRRSCR